MSLKDKMLTVHEVSDLSGVSVRTLHYYDSIGLLSPCTTTDTGYRLYGRAELEKLQDIMLFKELEFSLKDIAKMVNDPNFDRQRALTDQINLLKLRKDHLDELITYAETLRKEGEEKMSFEPFDKSKIEAYSKAAKEIWGKTDAYKEYEEKSAGQTDTQKRQAAGDLMDIFFEFGNIKDKDPACDEAQKLVKKLQDHISKNYYTCTKTILAGLGKMYAAGGEMTDNIDVAGGKGCAEFSSKAIEKYCEK